MRFLSSLFLAGAALLLLLTAPGSAQFGAALEVLGDEVLVGEPQNSLRPGLVFVYRKAADGNWIEVLQLDAGDDARPGDGFGFALASDGNLLLAGALEQNEGRGAAYLFGRGAGGAWNAAGTLTSGRVEAGDRFGASVAIAGDWAFVGAPRHGEGTGAVLLFRRGEGGEWLEAGVLATEGGMAGDFLGHRIAVEGDLLAVSAPGRSERAGTVFVFRRRGEGWIPSGQLSTAGLESNAGFGSALGIAEGQILVGAPGFGGGAGATFLFGEGAEAGSWMEQGRLVAFDGGRQDGFGSAVARAGDELWVGAPRSSQFRGVVYRFERAGNRWASSSRLNANDAASRVGFGGSLAASGSVAATGLPGADNGAGIVAILERGADGDWMEAARVASPPESLPVLAGETRECSEEGLAADLFPCDGIEILGFLPITEIGGGRGISLNDIWGWTDPESGQNYALVGRTDGSAFVDISDPNNPVFVGQMLRTEGSPVAVWRDLKVYENHMYVVADASGAHGMQVFDLARLREYQGEPITFEPDLTYDRINSAHNLVINEETGFAYAVGASSGGETCGGGLHMIDIREPKDPTFVGCFSDGQTGRASTGYAHDAQCVVYRGPDERYQGREICMGANETALSIADVTDKANPVSVSRATYPNVAYSHQGWFDDDHRYFYMNDELDELGGLVDHTRTIIWDLERLDDPQVAAEYLAPVRSSDHNLYIIGDLMYQSNYASGLRILDISDRTNPLEVGHLVTSPYADDAPGFPGSWSNFPFFEDGTIAVSSIGEGLFLVRHAPRRTVF